MPFRISCRAVAVLCMCTYLQVQGRSLYRHPLKCRSDEYYNQATHYCEECKGLCQPQRDTLAQCRRLCPGYQVTPIPDTPRTTTPKPTSPPVAHLKKKNKDEELESIWRFLYGLSAALSATVILMLVYCVVQRRKENRFKKLMLLEHEERQERPPGKQAAGTQTDNPPRQAAPPSAPPTRASQPEVEPLLTEPGKPVPEEGDGDVPTAPSSRVPIYSTDTTPHDLSSSLLWEDQETAQTNLETTC